jgi:hypothetical protein
MKIGDRTKSATMYTGKHNEVTFYKINAGVVGLG